MRARAGQWMFVVAIMLAVSNRSTGQETPVTTLLEQELLRENATRLAREARQKGDAVRGAYLFQQSALTCVKCHEAQGKVPPIGPDLSRHDKTPTDEYLIQSLLEPSKSIRKGFESVTLITTAGSTVAGILAGETKEELLLRDPAKDFKLIRIAQKDIDQRILNKVSVMPTGLVNQLANRQQFLDLVRYLIEIAEKGPHRAEELRPLHVSIPLPEYEKNIDHAGMISSFDAASFKRGEKIYRIICANCHGTHDRVGSMPTSLPFAKGKFKNGSDPFSMYQTLTRGFGLMAPQSWMVPQQKYDVIHYIREAYLKSRKAGEYVQTDKDYLARLPRGTSRGPAASSIEPWITMNYGPSLINTLEVGDTGNLAYTGIAVRLDEGPGGIAQGRYWMLFDHDTMRWAGAWSGRGFINWRGIHFNGEHGTHPQTVGEIHWQNPMGPGWANPTDAKNPFTDTRLVGRDNKRYGPLPRDWSQYKGLYHFGNKAIVRYTVGKTSVLEMPALVAATPVPLFSRTMNIGPRDRDMILRVAQQAGPSTLNTRNGPGDSTVALLSDSAAPATKKAGSFKFDGKTSVAFEGKSFDLTRKDYTIVARIKTRKGGSLFAKTIAGKNWVPDGKSLFIRDGRLVFDIGWVGAVTSRKRIADGRWHDVAMTWQQGNGQVNLYIDGKLDASGTLKPKSTVKGDAVSVGFTSANFPRGKTYFEGVIAELRFFQRRLSDQEIAAGSAKRPGEGLQGHWRFDNAQAEHIADLSGNGHTGRITVGEGDERLRQGTLVAGVSESKGMEFFVDADGQLCLRIAAGKQPLRFTLWVGRMNKGDDIDAVLASAPRDGLDTDLVPLTRGASPRWPQVLHTEIKPGEETGPFAVDVLQHPPSNPWSARMRFTGVDFFKNTRHAALCTWDGDVWLVQFEDAKRLSWKRIASGLFQPLGLRIVDDVIYVSCRDQIVRLRDIDGDGETDYYECFNGDHQVTDHFHEFAMDLQTDDEGNFYYARAARHALPALVPHHGTLLKVSKDGSRTDILATGFRAPNGVCLNTDHTFFLTDQEGHWTPKNRINWVEAGGFYGNIFGYHDVQSTADDAMKQPVCWITNKMDRSPSELLWVPKNSWAPLGGRLLSLSYGYGKIFLVPHEKRHGVMQGGVVALPIASFPTGVMRARFNSGDGQFYGCGMNAWGSNQQQPGGFYRVRRTKNPLYLPVEITAHAKGIDIQFSGKLSEKSAADPKSLQIKVWSLKRGANYGSKHYDERILPVAATSLGPDQKTLTLVIPDLTPTQCMEIRYSLMAENGEAVSGVIHNTIHRLDP